MTSSQRKIYEMFSRIELWESLEHNGENSVETEAKQATVFNKAAQFKRKKP